MYFVYMCSTVTCCHPVFKYYCSTEGLQVSENLTKFIIYDLNFCLREIVSLSNHVLF